MYVIVQYPLCVLKLIVDRTLCRIILSIIILVINKLHSHFAAVNFFFDDSYGYRPNWTLLSPVRPILIQCVNYIAHCFPSFFPLFSYFDWRRAYKGNLLLQDLVTHEKKNLLRNDSKKSYECTSWSAVRRIFWIIGTRQCIEFYNAYRIHHVYHVIYHTYLPYRYTATFMEDVRAYF